MSRRLVCIEDDPEVTELMRLIVARHGFELLEARNGLRGIEMVKETQPDLVLLDLMMPGLDGWEVFDQLKSNPETKNVPIIIVTARAHFDDRVAEMRAANDGNLLTKPFTPAQLIQAINRILRIS
ncbi:MAG: response regulator [Chloroflexota bacterium]